MSAGAVRTLAFEGGALTAESFDVGEVEDRAAQPGTLVWVDVSLPHRADVLRLLGARLSFSELVVEDAVSRHERPKYDEHEGYDFVNVYAVRQDPAGDVVSCERAVLPSREVVAALIRRENGETSVLRPHYQDLYDHVLRASERSEDLREMVTTVFETSLSLQDRRLNIIIRKPTSWAAIIAVPTAITGYFDQNVAFPGPGSWWGLLLSTALIGVTAGVLFLLFRRRDWL